MPRKTEWIHKIPEIIGHLRIDSRELIDRAAIEDLFGVGSRQAARILSRMGASTLGGAKVIAPPVLQGRLAQLQADAGVVFEQKRREDLHRKLESVRWEARSRQIQIPAGPRLEGLSLRNLPEDIRLETGELTIRFSSPVELLQKLMLLTQAISTDWETLAKRYP